MSSRLTAMDIEGQEFPSKLRGYDRNEVRLYLRSVAEEVERLNLENATLREERGRLSDELDEHRSRQRSLQEALVAAQSLAAEVKEQARSESEHVLQEARMRAERMLEQAQDQLSKIEEEIGRAKVERDTFENRVRNVLEEHQALLDLRKMEREQTENVRFLHRRSSAETG